MLSGGLSKVLQKRGVNIERARSNAVKSVRDYDVHVTVPCFGYSDLVAYYADSCMNTDDRWRQVAVPLVLIHACDDPMVDVDSLHAEWALENPNLFFLLTAT